MAYPSYDAAAETMIEDAREFAQRGWMLGTSGNLSVRVGEDEFMVTASGRDKGRLGPKDFVVCPLEGANSRARSDAEPSAETVLHRVVYRRLDKVGAVYHVHEPHAAYCSERDSELGATLMAGAEMIKGLGIREPEARVRIPIFENHFDVDRIAEEVDGYLTTHDPPRAPGFNIANHGYYAWGRTPFEAKRHVETFAYLFRYSWELGNGS